MTRTTFPPDQPVDPRRLNALADRIDLSLRQLRRAIAASGQIFSGFVVTLREDRVHVSPGLAFDGDGRAVALADPLALPLPEGRGPYWLVAHQETEVDDSGAAQRHDLDIIGLDWHPSAPTADRYIPIARLHQTDGGWQADGSVARRVSSATSDDLSARLTRLERALEAEFSKIEARFAQLLSAPSSDTDIDGLQDRLQEELTLEIWDEIRPELNQLRSELEAIADRPTTIGPDRGGFTPLQALHGVGTKLATVLADQGVVTVSDLLAEASTAAGRTRLLETELTEGRLRHLYRQADLLRLHGIGQGEVLLLEAVGVESTATLATQEPRDLYNRLVQHARQAEGVPPPALTWVESWVVQAQRLPPVALW